MSIAEMMRKNREESQMTLEQVADKLGVPEYLVKYLEDPSAPNPELEEVLAEALAISTREFRGEVRRPTKEERQDARATYPNLRKFLIDPERCENPAEARELFGDQPLSLPEHNLLLYLSTNALNFFCTTNRSSFEFDKYLFNMHASLLARLEKSLESSDLSAEQKEERRAAGQADVFACESMENIAVLICDRFAAEFEKKLTQGEHGYEEEVGLPFRWRADKELMRIDIRSTAGKVLDTICLLDVKTRKKG